MSFWRFYYHIVWATRERAPLIDKHVEGILDAAIQEKSCALETQILAIGCMPDHIHVAVMVPPTLAVADWVRHVKGASSHAVNTALPNRPERFRWQAQYGAVTFGATNLDIVMDYIQHQHERHAARATYRYLERIEGDT